MKFEMVVDGNITPRTVYPDTSPFDIDVLIKGGGLFNFTSTLGVWYKPLPCLEIAAAGQFIPMDLNIPARIYLNPERIKLTAPIVVMKNGVPDNRVKFGMTIPPSLRTGIRYIHQKGGKEIFDLELDFDVEFWSMMKGYTLDAGMTARVLGQTFSIDKINIDKKWTDTFSVRLGGDYNVIPDRLRVRAGFFYESPSTRRAYTYLDFLSLDRFGPSVGLTVSFYGVDLSLAYAYVLQMPMVVTEDQSRVYQQAPGSPCKPPYADANLCDEHYLGKPSAPINAGTYIENYHFFNAGISYNFAALYGKK
jgi:long-subunit fatty acid transport protein